MVRVGWVVGFVTSVCTIGLNKCVNNATKKVAERLGKDTNNKHISSWAQNPVPLDILLKPQD